MRYFKNATRLGQYTDIQTGVTIRRKQIIALKQPTPGMKKFITKKGILEVTEAEYNEWLAKQPKPEQAAKETIPSDQLPPPVDEFAEQKAAIAQEKAAQPAKKPFAKSQPKPEAETVAAREKIVSKGE